MCMKIKHIKIPDNTTLITNPVMIPKTMKEKYINIEIGKNCHVFIIEILEGSEAYHSREVEILIGEGSIVQLGVMQNLSQETNSSTARTAILQKDSRLEWTFLDTGGKTVFSSMKTILKGPGSEVKTKLMTYGTGIQQFDYDVSSLHSAPETASTIIQKAVLDNKARMVINGLVNISKNASGSRGFQKEDTLLLSEDAAATPIPNLEINNHDVQCSHGTTVGQIDKDILFYALSRGMDEKTATSMVVKGFLEPVIASSPEPLQQEMVRKLVEKRLEERA